MASYGNAPFLIVFGHKINFIGTLIGGCFPPFLNILLRSSWATTGSSHEKMQGTPPRSGGLAFIYVLGTHHFHDDTLQSVSLL